LNSPVDSLLIKRIVISAYNFAIETVLNAWIGPVTVVFLFYFYPSGINYFNKALRFYRDIGVPYPDKKSLRNYNCLDDFQTNIHGIRSLGEINILLRGESIHEYKDKIDFNLPTFFVNFKRGILDIDKKDIVHITADYTRYNKMIKDNLTPIIFIGRTGDTEGEYCCNNNKHEIFCKDKNLIADIIHSSNQKGVSFGSGLPSIVALSKLSNKVNIYGWDFYSNDFLEKKSHFQFIGYLLSREKNHGSPLGITIRKLINVYYASCLSKDNKFYIHSYLRNTSDNLNIIKKIRKVMYV